jgi:uncharacterized protein (DUF2236 family)
MTNTDTDTVVSAPLGPGSLTWRHHGDRLGLLLLWRTGTLQNMHPAVNSALQQLSTFFEDPWDRLFRSIPPIAGVIYDEDAEKTAGEVRDYHRDIKGSDDGHGRRWSALNPEVFWWTHVTFVEAIVATNEFFGTPLTLAEKDQLVRESVTWWQRYGLSMRPVVTTWAEFDAYFQHMLEHELEHNETTRWAMSAPEQAIPAPPFVPGPVWKVLRWPTMKANVWLGAGLMPPKARETLELNRSTRDQYALDAMSFIVRAVWPRLPERVRYQPRAYEAIRRVRSAA